MNFLDFLFPKLCIGCKINGAYLCSKCLSSCENVALICPVCFESSLNGSTHKSCKNLEKLDGLISCKLYDSVVGRAIGIFKYSFAFDMTKEIGEILVSNINIRELITNSDILTFVPIHRKRFNWRGFNQSQLLAKYVSFKFKNILFMPVVRKTKSSKPQAKLSKKERERNISGLFAVINEAGLKFRDKKVVIVDDVFTTGATLHEIAKILKQNGAKSVWGITVAR